MTEIDLPLDQPGGSTVTVAAEGGNAVARTVLPSGVRVLTESMPGLRSATMGAWVAVGSRDEAARHLGSTHFLEHMLFKGTPRRSAMDIASTFDRIGGESNAVTGKEHTVYFAKVIADDLPTAIDVITDMVTAATIDADDFASERGVILEELAMYEDEPSDVVHEKFAETLLGAHELGRPIGGTPDTINAVGRDDVLTHYRQHYVPPTLVVTCAGGLQHEDVVTSVSQHLATVGWGDGTAPPVARRSTSNGNPVAASGESLVVSRDIEQAHVIVGTTGLSATDVDRYTMSVLNTILGGGMSSRLFQEVREKRGLAYSVYAFSQSYADGGYLGMYAACSPTNIDTVVSLLVSEWEALAARGVTDDELQRGIGQLTGGMVLGLEDSSSRMSRLGRAEIVHGSFTPLDEAVARVRAVTADGIRALAARLAAQPRTTAVVGPFDADRTFGATAI
mgnify:CR=1 FL=1